MFALWETEYNILTNSIVFVATVFLCVYAYFKYSYTYWARKGVPYLPPTFPLGNNPVVGAEALSYGLESRNWYNAFKKMGVRFGGVWSFCTKSLVLIDPELIKDVMTKDFNFFVNRDFYHNADDDPKSNNVFVAEGEEWRYMRQKISSAFTSAKMRYMFDSVSKCSDVLASLFEQAAVSKKEISLNPLLNKYTMDNIGVVAFGLNFNCLLSENEQLARLGEIGKRPNLRNRLVRLTCRIAPDFARKIGLSTLEKSVTEFFGSVILDSVEQRKKLDFKRNDFVQLLMEIQESSIKDNSRFTMDDLVANCIIFFIAGFDTSTKTMQFTLLELGRNQDLQDKVRESINSVLSKYNGELTYEGLQEMTYLRQVVEETLRLYPPVLTLTRICQKDYKFKSSDVVIEKGTTVIISPIGLHRDPDLFPNPEKYDPERFSAANKGNIVPYSYLPFGEGPRNCIGRRFGYMQSMIALVRILSSYKIVLSPKMTYPAPIQYGQFAFETDEIFVTASKAK